MSTLQEIDLAVNIPQNAPMHIYAAAAEKCLEWSRPDSALKVCDLGLQRHPSYAGLRLFRAESLLLQNRAEHAEADLRAVLLAEPQHPRALKLLGHTLMTQRRFREALPVLERAEFILMGDQDIPQWLAAAEKGAEAEALAPPDAPTVDAAPGASEVAGRLADLVSVPGALAASVTLGQWESHGGPEWDAYETALKGMRALEESMGSVLSEAGFGPLTDISLHEGAALLTAHFAEDATVRMAADGRTREGLVAWQCRKALGEVAE